MDKNESPKHTRIGESNYQKKLMVNGWWFSAGVIHYDLIEPDS